MTSNPLKWHGGKSYLADWLISLMPPHTLYREPFFGGGDVLFRKSCEGIGEAVNDRNLDLTNFWQVVRDPAHFTQFRRLCDATPLSQIDWNDANAQEGGLPDFRAWAFFVKYRQSRQGLGKDYTTPTSRTRRGMNEQVSAWLSAVEGLPEAHARLRRVEVCCMDACAFIKKYDAADALFYCDPPYLHETRHKSARDSYECEMTDDAHCRLLQHLDQIKGRFLLSGYSNPVYDSFARASRWRREDKRIDNKASGAKSKAKKTESVWMNF